jgi:hypothetical protein
MLTTHGVGIRLGNRWREVHMLTTVGEGQLLTADGGGGGGPLTDKRWGGGVHMLTS